MYILQTTLFAPHDANVGAKLIVPEIPGLETVYSLQICPKKFKLLRYARRSEGFYMGACSGISADRRLSRERGNEQQNVSQRLSCATILGLNDMEQILIVWGYAVALFYIGVSGSYIAVFRSAASENRGFARQLAGLTVGVHFAYLLFAVFQFGRLPMATVYEALSVTAFFISLMYIFIHFTSGESGTGVFVFPVAALLQIISAMKIRQTATFDPVLVSPFFAVHTIPSIMAYAAFLISMFYSGMYHLMHRQIKLRKLGLFYEKLPSLEALDGLNNRAISLGFALLTLGIITGMLWGIRAWKDVSPLDPKLLISYALLW